MKPTDRSERWMKGTSFHTSVAPLRRRLICNAEGLEGSGKTRFGLSAPGNVAYFAGDRNYEGVIHEMQAIKRKRGERIFPAYYPFEPPDGQDLDAVADTARPIRKQFRADYLAALKAPRSEVASLVVDSGSFFWELYRIAQFGKLTQIPPIMYGQVNAMFVSLIHLAKQYDKNVVFIHRLGEEWKSDKKGKSYQTGKLKRIGFKELGYEVQCSVRLWRDQLAGEGIFDAGTGPFWLEVRKCTVNNDVVGMKLKGKNITFGNLMDLVFPEDEEEDEDED